MSETKFTKGEWRVEGDSMSVGSNYRGKFYVTSNCFDGDIDDASKANAHLIARAPNLYHALKSTTEELAFVIDRYNKKVKDPAHFIDAETCHRNQIELAKARGEKC